MKKHRMRKINKILEIPQEVYSDVPKITIIGFDEMIIENYKGILEYEEFFIRISTYKGIISINGYQLNLETMTNDDIIILIFLCSLKLYYTYKYSIVYC